MCGSRVHQPTTRKRSRRTSFRLIAQGPSASSVPRREATPRRLAGVNTSNKQISFVLYSRKLLPFTITRQANARHCLSTKKEGNHTCLKTAGIQPPCAKSPSARVARVLSRPTSTVIAAPATAPKITRRVIITGDRELPSSLICES